MPNGLTNPFINPEFLKLICSKKMIWSIFKMAWGTIRPEFNLDGIAGELVQISSMPKKDERIKAIIDCIELRLTFNGTAHRWCEWLEDNDKIAIMIVVNKTAHQLDELMGGV